MEDEGYILRERADPGRGVRRRMSRKALGTLGEEIAARRLEELGYRILERNFRCPIGEADIVALEGDVLVFVEVRARSSAACGTPAESVTPLKRRKMRQVARWYLASREGSSRTPVRFDVVAVHMYGADATRVDVIRSAF